jgi:hypothetical protein
LCSLFEICKNLPDFKVIRPNSQKLIAISKIKDNGVFQSGYLILSSGLDHRSDGIKAKDQALLHCKVVQITNTVLNYTMNFAFTWLKRDVYPVQKTGEMTNAPVKNYGCILFPAAGE